MIGSQMDGSIQKLSCEPYEYVVPDTGEVIEMAHRWSFVPTESKQNQNAKVTLPDFSSVEELMA